MCQLIPRKVMEVKGDRARVEYDGGHRWVGITATLGPLAVGEYVHVYAGVAIEKVSDEEAAEQIRFLRELEERFPEGEAG